MRVRNLGLAAAVALLATAAIPAPADAALILAGTINGTLFCATDNNSSCSNGIQLNDTDGAIGSLSLNTTTLAGVTVSGSLHTSVNGSIQDILDSSSLAIRNLTAGNILADVAIGATNYTGPTTTISTSGSGTWQNAFGSTINMRWFADTANGQGGETPLDLPGALLASFLDTAGTGVDSFATNGGPFAFLTNGNPYSMTVGFSMNLAGTTNLQTPSSLISRGQTEITDFTPVPEPGSMFLLGSGVLYGFRKLRKRNKA